MATAQIDTVIRQLRRAMLRQIAAGKTDGQLLASFIEQKDEAAFEALVHRHGPMVFGVCRRIIGNHHDAEDAFQATFLVLARKASSVKPRERVANWLHGVALRTAMKVKATTAKRRGREKQVTEMPEPEIVQQDQWRDLQPLLDQELNGLPENYRLPILLCDLEGKTIKEAAQQLGWPQGTLAGRLARGRKLLAKRLMNRGVALSAGSLAVIVSPNVASAAVPTSLMSSTVKAATMIAAGQAAVVGMVPAQVAALTEGVLKTMLLTKLKTATAGLLLVSLALGGGAGLLYQTQAAGQPKALRTRETIEKQKIEKLLESPVDLNFTNVPLHDVVDALRSKLERNIFVDEPALAEKGISLDAPVTLRLDHVSLKTALKLLLYNLHLVYTVVDDVIVLTTPENEGKVGLILEVASKKDKGDRPPQAAPQRQYVIMSRLVEAGPDQPKEILRLPKLTLDDGQLAPLHITDGPENLLAKVVDDEKIKIGTFFDVRVRRWGGNRVLLRLSFQRNEVEKSNVSEVRVLGNSVQAIQVVELHKPAKIVFQKDAKGSEQRWVEITVDEQPSPAALAPSK